MLCLLAWLNNLLKTLADWILVTSKLSPLFSGQSRYAHHIPHSHWSPGTGGFEREARHWLSLRDRFLGLARPSTPSGPLGGTRWLRRAKAARELLQLAHRLRPTLRLPPRQPQGLGCQKQAGDDRASNADRLPGEESLRSALRLRTFSSKILVILRTGFKSGHTWPRKVESREQYYYSQHF